MGKKKRHKKSSKDHSAEKLIFATATIQLIQAIIELIEKLIEWVAGEVISFPCKDRITFFNPIVNR